LQVLSQEMTSALQAQKTECQDVAAKLSAADEELKKAQVNLQRMQADHELASQALDAEKSKAKELICERDQVLILDSASSLCHLCHHDNLSYVRCQLT
jgi:DNA-binding FrmR family transcriptional regulator